MPLIRGCANYASDIHGPLIGMYKALQGGWTPPATVSEEEYQAARRGAFDDPLSAFIGYGASFGAKWFGGFARNPNRPRDSAQEARNSLLAAFGAMPPVTFFQADFLSTDPPAPGMLIYCDPPYIGTEGYDAIGGRFDHEVFWQRCRDLSKAGHSVVISEYQAPEDFKPVLEIPVITALRTAAAGNRPEPRIERLFRYVNDPGPQLAQARLF